MNYPGQDKVVSYLGSLQDIVGDPVCKRFCEDMKVKAAQDGGLQVVIDSCDLESDFFKMPGVLNNPFYKMIHRRLVEVVRRFCVYVRDNGKEPFSTYQALVNAACMVMDFDNLDEIYSFSLEWE